MNFKLEHNFEYGIVIKVIQPRNSDSAIDMRVNLSGSQEERVRCKIDHIFECDMNI